MQVSEEIYKFTGRRYSGQSCMDKVKNMKQLYKQRKDEEDQSGTGSLPPWPFQKAMDEIMEKNAEVTLKHTHEVCVAGITDKRAKRQSSGKIS